MLTFMYENRREIQKCKDVVDKNPYDVKEINKEKKRIKTESLGLFFLLFLLTLLSFSRRDSTDCKKQHGTEMKSVGNYEKISLQSLGQER